MDSDLKKDVLKIRQFISFSFIFQMILINSGNVMFFENFR